MLDRVNSLQHQPNDRWSMKLTKQTNRTDSAQQPTVSLVCPCLKGGWHTFPQFFDKLNGNTVSWFSLKQWQLISGATQYKKIRYVSSLIHTFFWILCRCFFVFFCNVYMAKESLLSWWRGLPGHSSGAKVPAQRKQRRYKREVSSRDWSNPWCISPPPTEAGYYFSKLNLSAPPQASLTKQSRNLSINRAVKSPLKPLLKKGPQPGGRGTHFINI